MNIYPHQYAPINKNSPTLLPTSESCFFANLLSLIPAFALLIYLKHIGTFSTLAVFAFFTITLSISALILEFLLRARHHTNISFTFHSLSISRIFFKLLGLFFIWGVMAFLYWLLPLYNDKLFTIYFSTLQSYWWVGTIIAIGYFLLMDSLFPNSNDAYFHLGRWLMFQNPSINRFEMIELWRGWGVKFFYLALMLPYLLKRLEWFLSADFSNMFEHHYATFYYFNQLIFLLDLSFAAVGYIMTFRLLNTQIRSSEPTLLGWIVALGCYWPFWGVLLNGYFFQYNTGVSWVSIWQNTGIWFVLWGGAILLCELIYSLATIALGLRFSNLTYRGLVTSGPYRFTKHPAYVFKNISWWLISLPFMAWSNDWETALRGSILLLGVNALYYLRAKTEENHLSHYPEYVDYALYMNQHSIFAPFAKLLPFLRYKAPNKK